MKEMLDKLLRKQYGELTDEIIRGYTKKVTTFRINTIKTTVEEVIKILDDSQIKYKRVAFSETAIIVENPEYEIRTWDLYNEGKIYLQSLSSMLPVIILNPKEGENILDMASAPGGKTTQIATLSNNQALIMATEKNKIRCDRLKYNINKQGANKVTVLNEDARNLDEFFSFDKILLDAPCSGSGTIVLENEKDLKYFNEELINRSKKTQYELLKKAIKLLKKDGELIYSTCSILKEENEDNVERILKEEKVELIPIEPLEQVPILPVKIEGTMCVLPTEQYEGFFVAKLRKISE